MAHSKGQAHAKGHSGGHFGHGGHHSGSAAHAQPASHTGDHLQNDHNKKHAAHGHGQMEQHGGAFPAGPGGM